MNGLSRTKGYAPAFFTDIGSRSPSRILDLARPWRTVGGDAEPTDVHKPTPLQRRILALIVVKNCFRLAQSLQHGPFECPKSKCRPPSVREAPRAFTFGPRYTKRFKNTDAFDARCKAWHRSCRRSNENSGPGTGRETWGTKAPKSQRLGRGGMSWPQEWWPAPRFCARAKAKVTHFFSVLHPPAARTLAFSMVRRYGPPRESGALKTFRSAIRC